MNLYDILELSPEAKHEEIRRAFRRLALRHHPDASGSPDSARFRALQHAYEILSDPRKRAEYDRGRTQMVPVTVIRNPRPAATVEPLIPPGPGASRSRSHFSPGYSYEREELLLGDLLRFMDLFWRRF